MTLSEFDNEIRKDYNVVCGCDEAGRGPLAGPVCAAAVILPNGLVIDGVNDSKKLSEKKREELYSIIVENCYVGVGEASPTEIDDINILNATFLAMKRALEDLKDNMKLENIKVDLVLVDGNHKIRGYSEYTQKEVIKGDSKSLSIAAASIIAKVTRDRQMIETHEKHPEYMFNKHKGYGTKLHREKLLIHGHIKVKTLLNFLVLC